MVHSEIAHNRSAGAGTAKKYNAVVTRKFCNCAKRHHQLRNPTGHTGAGTAKNIYDRIVTRQFCNCTKEAYERLMLILARYGYCYPYGANVARGG